VCNNISFGFQERGYKEGGEEQGEGERDLPFFFLLLPPRLAMEPPCTHEDHDGYKICPFSPSYSPPDSNTSSSSSSFPPNQRKRKAQEEETTDRWYTGYSLLSAANMMETSVLEYSPTVIKRISLNLDLVRGGERIPLGPPSTVETHFKSDSVTGTSIHVADDLLFGKGPGVYEPAWSGPYTFSLCPHPARGSEGGDLRATIELTAVWTDDASSENGGAPKRKLIGSCPVNMDDVKCSRSRIILEGLRGDRGSGKPLKYLYSIQLLAAKTAESGTVRPDEWNRRNRHNYIYAAQAVSVPAISKALLKFLGDIVEPCHSSHRRVRSAKATFIKARNAFRNADRDLKRSLDEYKVARARLDSEFPDPETPTTTATPETTREAGGAVNDNNDNDETKEKKRKKTKVDGDPDDDKDRGTRPDGPPPPPSSSSKDASRDYQKDPDTPDRLWELFEKRDLQGISDMALLYEDKLRLALVKPWRKLVPGLIEHGDVELLQQIDYLAFPDLAHGRAADYGTISEDDNADELLALTLPGDHIRMLKYVLKGFALDRWGEVDVLKDLRKIQRRNKTKCPQIVAYLKARLDSDDSGRT